MGYAGRQRDRFTHLLGGFGMLHHLFALVIGHGHAQGARHFTEFVAEANSRCYGFGAIHFRLDRQTRGSLYQRTDSRTVVGTNDEASLPVILNPMARHQAVFDPGFIE
ncbi:hypothetical protein QHL1GM_11085 [Halomonas sp. QHL1]|nr:hypothetical protein QHL1GM_11085 [Halomonas sp. QHL1]